MIADPDPAHSDPQSLGPALGPALIEHCGGRLSDLAWFRSTWQHGGASTAFARWRLDDGREVEALVKLPIGPTEWRWTTRLGRWERWDAPESVRLPTPRVLAAGEHLGSYDLMWLITEKLRGFEAGSSFDEAAAVRLLSSVARMQGMADGLGLTGQAPTTDWARLVAKSREDLKRFEVPEAQRWNEALKHVQRHLPRLDAMWRSRACNAWCHGDVHPGNAMRRDGSPDAVLIDLALVHRGHWVEDAVYLERQFWGREERLGGLKPVGTLARIRRELGLSSSDHYAEVANLRRLLMAATTPAFVLQEGHPRHLHAALEVVEKLLPRVVG